MHIYLDTSVLGGYFDEEFKEETRKLWELGKTGNYVFYISRITLNELLFAPEWVRELSRKSFTDEHVLPLTEEAEKLAEAYLAHGVVPSQYQEDAEHVAIATVNHLLVIVSWNFKHLVNLERERGFNAVNILLGYPQVRIISPQNIVYE